VKLNDGTSNQLVEEETLSIRIATAKVAMKQENAKTFRKS
jgi:hypothetical protein